jgi:hypothetical protein
MVSTSYIYLPAVVLLIVGIISTLIGGLASLNDDIVSWSLIVGSVIVALSIVSLFLGRYYAIVKQREAFRAVQRECVILNGEYEARRVQWKIVFKSRKHSVNTSTSPVESSLMKMFQPCSSCFTGSLPTLYINVPDSPGLGYLATSASCGSLESGLCQDADGESTDRMLSPLTYDETGRRRSIYCTHCGSRSLAPMTLLTEQPSCDGCNRSLELPPKYFVPLNIDSTPRGSSMDSRSHSFTFVA